MIKLPKSLVSVRERENLPICKTKRDVTLDIVRGIGIILMVIGHIGYPLNSFIYLFHMALFFIISGYFFNDKCWQTLKEVKFYILRKIKTLYIPFIIWNILLILLHNFFISINLYSTDYVSVFRGVCFDHTHYYTFVEIIKKIFYSLLFFHQERFGGATWFLRVLFFISVFSCIGHYVVYRYCRKENLDNIILFLYAFSFIIGYILSIIHLNFYSIGTMFTAAGLFYLGILIKKSDVNNCNIYVKALLLICSLLVILISSVMHIKIELSGNIYPNPIFLVLLSYCGFILIYYISIIIKKLDYIRKCIIFLGQNTLYILLFNTISLRFFSYIQIKIFDYPIYMLSSHPVISTNIEQTWIFYLLSSIFGSIILMYIWKVILFKIIYNFFQIIFCKH